MLARRIIAVSPDKAFGKQLAIALKAAGGAVDAHVTLDELGKGDLQAALIVLHLDGELADAAPGILARLSGDTRVIAILPRSNLAAVVDIMQASERVAGMMVAEDLNPKQLSAIATRVLAGDIFGLDKLVQWGTQIHSHLVGDYQEKSLCISQISEFAELMGVRRKYRESIEQCVDEMLMNALYDAPVDDQGKQIFSEIPTKTRISLRVEQKVVVQYACDGMQFSVSVRDTFGTLERSTVLRYLHKCLHNEQQIDRKAGGAGLGLYLMTNSSTDVYFNVLPGVATEAVCTFDLETPKLQLESFGFFTERIDAAGRLAAGPSRRLPSGTSFPVERRAPRPPPPARSLVPILGAMIGVMVVLIGIAVYQRLTAIPRTTLEVHTMPIGATVEVAGKNAGTAVAGELIVRELEVGRAYAVVARLEGYAPRESVVQPTKGRNEITLQLDALASRVILETAPTGAAIELDGKPIGITPLTVETLAPGVIVSLVFKKQGYHDATAKLTAPAPGKETRLIEPLVISEDLARVKLTSEPPGAQVVQNGNPLAAVMTPCEILVQAGKPQHLTLTMPGKVPAILAPFTPARGAEEIVLSQKLTDGVAVTITSTLAAKITVTSALHCIGLATPAECVLAPGTYSIDLTGPTSAHATRTIAVAATPLAVDFAFGFVQAGGPKQLLQLTNGPSVHRAAFEAGRHKVIVEDEDGGSHPVTVTVKAGATVTAN